MIKVSINQDKSYEVALSADQTVTVGDKVFQPSLTKLPSNEYLLNLNGKNYTIAVKNIQDEKNFTVLVNGNPYTLSIKGKYDILLEELGLDYGAASKITEVNSPMPGLVLKVLVSEGETVQKDTPLLILEAMKMENVLKSPGDGTVSKIWVSQKDAVEKNQKLISFA